MIEVIRCETRADMRAFCRMAKEIYPDRPPVSFTRLSLAVTPGRNPLLRPGSCAFLLAARDGKPAARALFGATGTAGWFSLFEAVDDARAVSELFRAAFELLLKWGCESVCGPQPADGSGFGIGLRVSGGGRVAWFPANPTYYPRLLEGCGFRVERRLRTYEISLGSARKNPYDGAEEWAKRRFGLRVSKLPLARRISLRDAWSVSGGEGADFERYARVYGRVCELSGKGFLLLAERDTAAVGFLLCIRERGAIRVLTAHVRPSDRGGPCIAALFDSLFRCAESDGASLIRTGTIDGENAASRRLAEHAGGVPEGEYAVYALDL